MIQKHIQDIFNIEKPFEFSYTQSPTMRNPYFHFHKSYEIHLLEKGQIDQYVEHSLYHQTPKKVIIFRNDELHRTSNPTGKMAKRFVLHFIPRYAQSFSSAQTDLLSCFTGHEPGEDNMRTLTDQEFETCKALFFKALKAVNSKNYGCDLTALCSFLELLSMVNKIYSTNNNESSVYSEYRIRPIVAYIDSHYKETISLQQIAQALSMDKFYMSHLFKKETHTTIFRYITLKRITVAKDLLLTGKSVIDVCCEAGFGDCSNFIRTFKKETGYTPKEFQKVMSSSIPARRKIPIP